MIKNCKYKCLVINILFFSTSVNTMICFIFLWFINKLLTYLPVTNNKYYEKTIF